MNDNAKIALGLAAIYYLCKGELPVLNCLPSLNVCNDDEEDNNDE